MVILKNKSVPIEKDSFILYNDKVEYGIQGARKRMNSKIKDEMTDSLFEAILKLESLEECYAFFEDICTINEIKSLAQRLEVAKLLEQKVTYTEIQTITGASTATISRVNRCLAYGSDGYKLILERIKK